MIRDMIEKCELSMKIALFIVAITLGMVFLLAGTRAALAASLRTESIINGDYIRLGDVFDGVKNADYVLGPAPQPGKDMILNARTLYKIASALDVEWQPSSSADQLVLKRQASIIPESEVTAAIEKKLKESSVGGKFSLRYMNTVADIVLPGDAEATLEVTAFNFDPQKDTFSAVVVAPSAKNPLKRLTLSGHVDRMIAVPVFKSGLRNGDIISSMDLDWIDLPQEKIAAGTILEEKDLINMTPRRPITAGKPMTANDLEHPKMVARGDLVTLVFENGPMVLTTKGKALQDGAMGDVVRVSNTDSNKNLQGVITAHREITIR